MIKYFISWVCLVSLGFSLDVNFSLETKYGDGNAVKEQLGTVEEYRFIENILDINSTFDNGLFVSTQLEYSDPPIFGIPVNGLNNFVVDYIGDHFSVKLGNLYSLYGRGLSLNMTQSQNIDYDNSVTGIEFKYTLNDLSLFGLWGKDEFNYRSVQTENPDLNLDNEVIFIGSELYNERLGIFQYSFMYEESIIDSNDIGYYSSGSSEIKSELEDRINQNGLEIPLLDTLKTIDHNIAWNVQLFGVDLYLENVWNTYTKMLGDTESGSKLYLSLYFDIAGTGITYEYKNYDQKYYLPTLAGAPIGFREGNSTLASRNNHTINWGDEVGHQIELNRAIGDFQWMGNLSFAYKHEIEGYEPVSFSQILKMDNKDDIYHQYPFRQFYSELSGYTLNDKLYIKLGIDQFDEFKGYNNPETVSAFTLPTMFTYDLGSGNSITSYIEWQNRIENTLDSDLDITENLDFLYHYFSFTFNYLNYLSLSFFYDDEIKNESNYYDFSNAATIDDAEAGCADATSFGYVCNENYYCTRNLDEIYNKWTGYDISYKINSTSQLSLFYGSQKGGLVCANGICAEQPGFDDGIKVTLRTIF